MTQDVTTRSLRAIVAAVLVTCVWACGAPSRLSPQPATTTTATSSSSARSDAPSTPASPSTSVPTASITLADLHATLVYAVCANQQCDVHVVDSTGRDRNVTNTPGAGTEEHQPDLSPDGSRIAFRCPHDPAEVENSDNDDICRINVDGSGRKNLTDNEVADYSTSWSADGRRIAFASGRGSTPGNPNDIYVMNADGSHVVRVTSSVGIDEYPVWSPDGSVIAFSCTDGGMHESGVGDFEVCLVRPDGSNRRRITDTPGICDPTGWSPDGRSLLYTCDPDGNGDAAHDVYVVTDDVSTRLTTTGGYGAKFTPDGRAVIYKDRDGFLWHLTPGGARARIDVPPFDGDWDLAFGG
jgi:Tol biopolymer transport system component